jgi:predicted TIM-barrel fold metal-dependent hydrolase
MNTLELFDLNGDIGQGTIQAPVFPDARAWLKHMDYLGVERSLVTHVAGREFNPLAGNRILLDALASAPGAADRLFPVFTVNPATFYEDGALDFLRTHLRAGTVKALGAFPATCRHPLLHLEPVLAELAPFRPLLLWNTTENPNGELDYRDLVDLAARFPEITFICRKKMWPGFGSVLDAMRRRPNIGIDISWLHMRRTIELLVESFGADRVFFGTGCKTHYGAAIAALMQASISGIDRAKIAHGNLERLLGVPAASGKVAGGRDDKPLWESLRNGRPVPLDILDAHGHIGPTNRGWYLPEVDVPATARETIRQMDRLGIRRIIVTSEAALFRDPLEGSRETERDLAPYPDRFSGYVAFNPRFADSLVPALDDLFASGFHVGFKILAAHWKIRIDDPGYLPALHYAEAHRLPILVHTWDDRWNSPRLLTEVVKNHPNASFLLGHSGGGTEGRIEAIELARRFPNVFLEFCGSFTTDYPWPETFSQVGFDRVVFGSDGGGAHDQAWELGHLLSQPVPDEKLRPVLAATMQTILARSQRTAAG